jgi:predicted nucleotidyltransferase
MLEEILDTKVKIRIARLLAGQNKPMTVSDVSRALGISKSRASECMRELQRDGFLERRDAGRSALYTLAPNSMAKALVKSLTQDRILLLRIERAVISRTRKFHPVSVVLFGSALEGIKPSSDLDFLLIHEKKIDESEIYRIVGELTQEFGFHVSIMTMNLRDFRKKAKRGEEFVLNVVARHKLIYGKEPEVIIW